MYVNTGLSGIDANGVFNYSYIMEGRGNWPIPIGGFDSRVLGGPGQGGTPDKDNLALCGSWIPELQVADCGPGQFFTAKFYQALGRATPPLVMVVNPPKPGSIVNDSTPIPTIKSISSVSQAPPGSTLINNTGAHTAQAQVDAAQTQAAAGAWGSTAAQSQLAYDPSNPAWIDAAVASGQISANDGMAYRARLQSTGQSLTPKPLQYNQQTAYQAAAPSIAQQYAQSQGFTPAPGGSLQPVPQPQQQTLYAAADRAAVDPTVLTQDQRTALAMQQHQNQNPTTAPGSSINLMTDAQLAALTQSINNTVPAAVAGPLDSGVSWIQQNPMIALGLAAAVFFLFAGGKR